MPGRRSPLTAAVAAALAATVLLAACGGGAGGRRDDEGRPGPPPERAGRRPPPADVDRAHTLLGAWVGRAGSGDPVRRRADTRALERALGVRLGIRHFFYPWSDTPDGRQERAAVADGALPMVSWNDGDNAATAAGADDARIRRVARMLDRLGTRAFLRFGWEMDADGAQGTGTVGPPDDYVAAFRRVHRIVRESGAERVELVWCPTVWGFRPGSDRDPTDWYPGDDVVDWVCADGYNWSADGRRWRSFDEVYGPFLDWAATVDKPVMVGEVGTMEDPGDPDRKARWILDLGRSVRCRHPQVRAVVWFHTDRVREGVHRDWRLDTSPAALAAASRVARDRWFGGPDETLRCPEPPSTDPTAVPAPSG